MEELALEPQLARATVDAVSGDGQVDCLQMDADLVRAPRLEADAQERVLREQLDELEVGHGVARSVRVERVPRRVATVAADRRLDPARP